MLIKKENKGSKSGVNTKVLQQSITKKGGGGSKNESQCTWPLLYVCKCTYGVKLWWLTSGSVEGLKLLSAVTNAHYMYCEVSHETDLTHGWPILWDL